MNTFVHNMLQDNNFRKENSPQNCQSEYDNVLLVHLRILKYADLFIFIVFIVFFMVTTYFPPMCG